MTQHTKNGLIRSIKEKMKNPKTQTIDEWYKDFDNSQNRRKKMTLILKNEGSDFEISPEGTHLATCYMIVDLGDQTTSFKGVEKVKPQVLLGWELTAEKMKDGRPFVASRIYNAFFQEKASLRIDLESWRGKKFTDEELSGFDISQLLNIACQVTITHSTTNDRTYANVTAITGLPKGVEALPLINTAVVYKDDEVDLHKLPEWIQKKVNSAVENKPSDFDDVDIPF